MVKKMNPKTIKVGDCIASERTLYWHCKYEKIIDTFIVVETTGNGICVIPIYHRLRESPKFISNYEIDESFRNATNEESAYCVDVLKEYVESEKKDISLLEKALCAFRHKKSGKSSARKTKKKPKT